MTPPNFVAIYAPIPSHPTLVPPNAKISTDNPAGDGPAEAIRARSDRPDPMAQMLAAVCERRRRRRACYNNGDDGGDDVCLAPHVRALVFIFFLGVSAPRLPRSMKNKQFH